MNVSLIPKTIFSLLQPSVTSLAARLFVLSDGRKGSAKYQPTVNSFYETGIVTSLYEHLLMSPVLQHLEIRHEMPYHGQVGAPRRVDLWLRPLNGGYPHLVEAGDFSVGKIHEDINKIKAINPNGANWFLAFFRNSEKLDPSNPGGIIQQSLGRANGLNNNLIELDQRLVSHFDVYRPNGEHEPFGVALLKGR